MKSGLFRRVSSAPAIMIGKGILYRLLTSLSYLSAKSGGGVFSGQIDSDFLILIAVMRFSFRCVFLPGFGVLACFLLYNRQVVGCVNIRRNLLGVSVVHMGIAFRRFFGQKCGEVETD